MAGDRAQACSEHGYRMDMAAYQRGWNEGLKEFCTFLAARLLAIEAATTSLATVRRARKASFWPAIFPRTRGISISSVSTVCSGISIAK